MNLHQRLKEERERLKFSQTAFAALATASKHSQINWEKGESSPNASALEAWSAVGLDVLYVITGNRMSPWETDLMANTAQVIKKAEPEGLGDLHKSLAKARTLRSAQELKRRPQYEKLTQALASCNDQDCQLVLNLALALTTRLAKA